MLVAGLTAVGLAVWWLLNAGSLRDRVEAEVRAEVPIGTSRQDAAAWVTRTYGGLIPHHSSDPTAERFVGRTIPDLAGVRADGLGGILRFTVRPRGIVTDVIQQLDPQQVFVYLLLDQNECVCGYFFLSLEELGRMEIEGRR